ncbi:MAG: aldo/keto reductase [Haloferacaceae archaeon]
MATPAGTDRYRERFADGLAANHFVTLDGVTISSVGIGTYLGDPTDEDDERYRDALITALECGINVVDTAINYRCQRSERVVARALDAAAVDRDEVFVATKGGYVPFDTDPPANVERHVEEEYVRPGLIDPDDLGKGLHCMTPEFIDDQVGRSLSNLGVETIDCYYVHNPEAQLPVRPREAVYDQLEATFARLEERVAAGELERYGLATWTAFRVESDDPSFLSLYEVLDRARAAADAVGADEHHFRAIQLPFNPMMAEAFTVRSHEARGDVAIPNVLSVAREADVGVFTSATLGQGEVLERGIPEDVEVWFEGDTVAQQAINFARSAPAVTCALVGSRRPAHVLENADAGTFDRMGDEAFDVVFEGPSEDDEQEVDRMETGAMGAGGPAGGDAPDPDGPGTDAEGGPSS